MDGSSPAGVAVDAPAGAGDADATVGATARACGSCTACCDGWLAANVRGHDLAPGSPCHFLGSGGCTIYEDRPHDPCRGFICGWLLPQSPFPDAFRPDKLGAIMLPKLWRSRRAYYIAFAGKSPDAQLIDWVRQYSAATGIPFLFRVDGRLKGYGSPEFQQYVLDKASRGEPPFPGVHPSAGGPSKLMPLDL